MLVAGCADSSRESGVQAQPLNVGYEEVRNTIESGEKSGLPGSLGNSFVTLDEYLAHLEVQGYLDRPHWEPMGDGRYRWNAGDGSEDVDPEIITREEMRERYDFPED